MSRGHDGASRRVATREVALSQILPLGAPYTPARELLLSSAVNGRSLGFFVAVSALACAGRRDVPDVPVPTKTAETVPENVIELAPVVSAPVVAELDPIMSEGDPELPTPCAELTADPHHFQFLDDVCKTKRVPVDHDREFVCPNVATSTTATLADGRVVAYRRGTEAPVYDDVLAGIVPSNVKIAVVLVRRIDSVPHYRYVSNGTQDVGFQPWSATKFIAVANAASTMRLASNGKVGLTSTVDLVPLGDLVTTVHNYDERHYSSNALAKWFHDVGGRVKLNDLLHGAWLHRPASETLGGNYGPGFVGLGFAFREQNGQTVTVPRDPGYSFDNRASAHTLAETLKRLVMHREDEATRLPGIAWADLKVLFYGATHSKWFAGQPGGMSADKSVYFQTHDLDATLAKAHGKFRVLSKSGMGWAQFVHAGYACFPSFGSDGQPVPDEGSEVFVAARADGPGGFVQNDRILARAYHDVLAALAANRI